MTDRVWVDRPDQCRKCEREMGGNYDYDAPVRHIGRGLCIKCYAVMKRADQLDRYPLLRSPGPLPEHKYRKDFCHFCSEIQFLADNGADPRTWHERMDSTVIALERRLYRHGKRDLVKRMAPFVNEIRRAERNRVVRSTA